MVRHGARGGKRFGTEAPNADEELSHTEPCSELGIDYQPRHTGGGAGGVSRIASRRLGLGESEIA